METIEIRGPLATIALTLDLRLPELSVAAGARADDASAESAGPNVALERGGLGSIVATIREPGASAGRLSAHAERLKLAIEAGGFEEFDAASRRQYFPSFVSQEASDGKVRLVFSALECSSSLPDEALAVMNADPEHLHFVARQIIGELADAIGENRAAERLLDLLGDDMVAPSLPAGSDPSLHVVRSLLTDWLAGEVTATELFDRAHTAIFASERAA